ncbi:DNA primase [Candidatus Saccharibacteria bacterium]|nr:DNA primase [Candidatus Saccharibacteria bacterium]
MDAVAEVKSRLNIEDVIGEYVQLKRSGRNFKGLSPWTSERTPSFMVSPEKQIWHDFSSGRGGDMFSFVMEMEGLDFRATLELLARKAGVDLEQFHPSHGQRQSRQKKRAIEALELSARFYQKQLTVNKAALQYLIKKRKFNKQTLLKWQLGYAPNTGFALTDFLTKHGFTTDETKLAGVSTQRSHRPNDMFRGRIMIPLHDSRGSVIGFTARLLIEDKDAPKYINTPQTVTYDKSSHVFGLHLAKEAIRKIGFVVAVEGNMDVISSHQAGIANVVATAGTAITERHLRELKKFSGDIRLCFDADQAGLTATERAIPLAQKVGVNLSIITISAKDPDALIQANVKAWEKAIAGSVYAPDWLIAHYKSALDLSTAQGKRTFTDALLVTIRRLSDAVEQEHYLKLVAEVADASLEAVKSKLKSGGGQTITALRKQPAAKADQEDKNLLEQQKLQDHFLAMMLMQPKVRQLLKNMKPEYFNESPSRILLDFLKKNPNFRGEPSKDFIEVLAAKPKAALPAENSKETLAGEQLLDIADYVKIMALQFEELYQDLSVDDLMKQAAHLKHRLLERYVKTQKEKLAAAMQSTSDEKILQRLMNQADELNKLIKKVED